MFVKAVSLINRLSLISIIAFLFVYFTVQCGDAPKRKIGISDTIVDGKETTQGFFPWQVAIYEEDTFLCGGSLIGKKHVLSAAHCFKGLENEPERFKITLGDHDRTDTIGVEQNVNVKKITLHSSYERQSTVNDISLIELQDEAKLSDFIQIICLPDAGEERKVNSYCQVTGRITFVLFLFSFQNFNFALS